MGAKIGTSTTVTSETTEKEDDGGTAVPDASVSPSTDNADGQETETTTTMSDETTTPEVVKESTSEKAKEEPSTTASSSTVAPVASTETTPVPKIEAAPRQVPKAEKFVRARVLETTFESFVPGYKKIVAEDKELMKVIQVIDDTIDQSISSSVMKVMDETINQSISNSVRYYAMIYTLILFGSIFACSLFCAVCTSCICPWVLKQCDEDSLEESQ